MDARIRFLMMVVVFSWHGKQMLAQLMANAGDDAQICRNETLQLGGSPSAEGGSDNYSYLWSPVTGLNDPTVANPVLSPVGNMEYTLTVTDNGDASTAVSVIRVTVKDVSTVNAGFDKSVCLHGDLVNVSVFGKIDGPVTTGIWSSSGDGVFPLGNEILSTSYTLGNNDKLVDSIYLILTTTNNTECPAVSDSFTLYIYPRSTVYAGESEIICDEMNRIDLNGQISGGSVTGVWTTNGKGSFDPSDADVNTSYVTHPEDSLLEHLEFVLTSTGLLGCAGASDSVQFTFTGKPEVFAGMDTVVAKRSVNLHGSAKNTDVLYWQTSGSGNFFPNDSSVSVTYFFGNDEITSGSLAEIILTGERPGCETVTDTLWMKTLFNSFPNAFTPNNDGINDVFMQGQYIEVYNRWGMLLYDGFNGWDGKYKGGPVAPGTYFFVMKEGDEKGARIVLKSSITLLNKQ